MFGIAFQILRRDNWKNFFYGGAVAADRGKPRMQVYNENLHRKRVPRSEEDLNLLLMRSTRAIKVDRPGVYLTVGKTKIYYRTDEFVLNYPGAVPPLGR